MRTQSPPIERKSPAWDDHRGILSLGEIVVKKIDKPAENQRAILCAFQIAGWAAWIANPIEADGYMDSGQRLGDAIYHLNKQRRRLIHFFRDGAGKGVCWEFVKRKRRRRKST